MSCWCAHRFSQTRRNLSSKEWLQSQKRSLEKSGMPGVQDVVLLLCNNYRRNDENSSLEPLGPLCANISRFGDRLCGIPP